MGLEAASFLADLVSTNPLFNDGKAQGDDHLRLIKLALQATFPGLAGAFGRVQSKSAGYTIVVNDNTSQISVTTAITLGLTAAATLGNKHSFSVDASGGDVTIDPDTTELINGVSTFVVPQGFIGFVWCNGIGFTCALSAKAPGATQTITNDTVLTATTLAGRKEVTALADITLPAASAALIGTKTIIHSSTTARVRIVPNGSNTIEGLNANYRVPSWSTIELECVSATGFVLLRAPQYFVGQLVPCAIAQTLPGFLPADFTPVSRTTYGGLFDLIGSTHGGGDGSTTFHVPDTRGRVLVGAGAGSNAEGVDASAVSTGSDTFTVASNDYRWITGMQVQLTTTGGLPAPLALVTNYWIIRAGQTTIKFATSFANAQNGSAINITTQGTGIHTVTQIILGRAVGERGGEETHAMSSTELLTHSHAFSVGGVQAASSAAINSSSTGNTNGFITSTGGNSAMNNMQPFGVAQYYVKT